MNLLQANSITGTLTIGKTNGTSSTADYKITVVDLFKNGKIREARALLCKETATEEMEELYRWMYENLDLWSNTPEGQDQAILEIRQGLVNHAIVADAEVNLSATLVKLSQIS